MVRVIGAARLLLRKTVWTATGSEAAGRALVDALENPDETLRTMAGIFIARGGARAVPLLREALGRRRSVPTVLTLLGDVGGDTVAYDIEPFRDDPDPDVARAASDALRILRIRLETPDEARGPTS